MRDCEIVVTTASLEKLSKVFWRSMKSRFLIENDEGCKEKYEAYKAEAARRGRRERVSYRPKVIYLTCLPSL